METVEAMPSVSEMVAWTWPLPVSAEPAPAVEGEPLAGRLAHDIDRHVGVDPVDRHRTVMPHPAGGVGNVGEPGHRPWTFSGDDIDAQAHPTGVSVVPPDPSKRYSMASLEPGGGPGAEKRSSSTG